MKKDITKKRLEEYNDVYADIFNALLFGGAKILEEDCLVSLPTESFTRNTDGSLRQGSRDIRKADSRNGRYRSIQEQIAERAEKEDVTMCVLIDEWENRGMQKGIETGAYSKAKTIARNMYLRNMTPEDTAAICEESPEQVLSWFAEWSKEK